MSPSQKPKPSVTNVKHLFWGGGRSGWAQKKTSMNSNMKKFATTTHNQFPNAGPLQLAHHFVFECEKTCVVMNMIMAYTASGLTG